MRRLFILVLLFSTPLFSQEDFFFQEDALAQEYFKNGDFKKALNEYQKLYDNAPNNINYINQIIAAYQQLELYNEAETFLLSLMKKIKYPAFMVELGYNHQLKNEVKKATAYYMKAIESVDENVNNSFSVARTFQSHSLLNQAISTYEKAMLLNPELNFNWQLAQIYGEQGDIEKMFNSYISFVETTPDALNTIKRAINDFISEDSTQENNVLFRKILLKKSQKDQNLIWNELLSWLFIQQKEYNKSFIQEKAIFNRQPESLNRIEELANMAVLEDEIEVAKAIFGFLIDTAQDLDTKIAAHYNLLKIETEESTVKDFKALGLKYQDFFKTFGKFSATLKAQIGYAHFLAFKMNASQKAISYLQDTLELPLSEMQKAEVKMALGDVLVLEEKFNEALIYYTQIQRNLKNSTISQEARFKVAKTSYFKGDFKWAESQLNILKASTSQLIANDALELKLLISDNKYEDSLQTALKLYAKADLLGFQNRKDDAISVLDQLLSAHQTEPIVEQALFKQAQLFEDNKQFKRAEDNYNNLLLSYRDGILADNACYALAELYAHELEQPEKAKMLYGQIVFDYPDSIYFVDARKKYRGLRGDAIK
ncbi:tetratricopeptide repeat protein [Mariniflexile ostreae]|uniref:Tetratricopeptide repeat protein n=1 Tax=Mariniflexile ostreae TaxID=1520892 RepID=A0ABV5FB63_9FLAO